ncbi:MAG: carbohydrate ABC transporter permease [bacterium]
MKPLVRKLQSGFAAIRRFLAAVKAFFHGRKSKIVHLISQIAIYVFLITISYVFLYPILRMISISFMTSSDLVNPEVNWFPKSLTFANYGIAWTVLDGSVSLFNSIKYSGVMALFQTIVSALTGFAFARYEFRGKKLLYTILLLSFIIPVPILLITQYNMFNSFYQAIGWTGIGKGLNTYDSQMIMAFFGQGVNSAILILIFVNFFKMIPNDLYEAGKIDGANPFQLFWHITIRLSLSTIIVVMLFSFVWNWNEDYVTKFLVGDGIQLFTNQLGKFDSLFPSRTTGMSHPAEGGEIQLVESFKMAATVISIIPLLLLYFVGQKSFVQGIEKTGITGE